VDGVWGLFWGFFSNFQPPDHFLIRHGGENSIAAGPKSFQTASTFGNKTPLGLALRGFLLVRIKRARMGDMLRGIQAKPFSCSAFSVWGRFPP